MANDVDAMQSLFWDDQRVVRYGIADEQHGADELRAWRAKQSALPLGRTLDGTQVTVVGADAAVVTTRFRYPGRPFVGRQTQVWIRRPEGWRIASAHVSEIAATDSDSAATK